MATKYLDTSGLTYFWGKIKAYGDAHWGNSTSVLDYYPVGSYYETSDTSFNPNTSWGGTWVLETEGLVHIGAGSNYSVGDTGGEAEHTLSVDEMPSHTHGNKSLTGHISIRRFGTSGTGTDLVLGGSGFTDGIVSNAATTWSGSHSVVNAAGRSQSNPLYDKMTVNASHEHDSVGGGQAYNNMPPFVVVNRWHRTA